MIDSETSPDPCKIRTIKDIAKTDLLPDLKVGRDMAEKQVKDNLAAIDQCIDNSRKRLDDIKKVGEEAVEEERIDHHHCRDEQEKKNTTQSSACSELDGYLSTISVPAEIPPNRPRDPMVTYVETMSDYFCPKGGKVKEMSEACVSASLDHFKHKASCDKMQATFEAGFCTWRTELIDTCSSGSECYQDMLKVYDGHAADTKELVEKWKAEYTALTKIICYSDVWLKDESAKTVNKEQLKHCQELKVDSSAMDIDFGTAPDQPVCSLEAVENYPGTPGFVTAEYEHYADYVTDAIPCLEPATSTPEPSMPETTGRATRRTTTEAPNPSAAYPTGNSFFKRGIHHSKLHTMKISELKKYARSLGASDDQLDHIDDHHDVKTSLVEFIKRMN